MTHTTLYEIGQRLVDRPDLTVTVADFKHQLTYHGEYWHMPPSLVLEIRSPVITYRVIHVPLHVPQLIRNLAELKTNEK